ncbi:hypothetical protein CEXT_131251, partial [Caerostris extrusa]
MLVTPHCHGIDEEYDNAIKKVPPPLSALSRMAGCKSRRQQPPTTLGRLEAA